MDLPELFLFGVFAATIFYFVTFFGTGSKQKGAKSSDLTKPVRIQLDPVNSECANLLEASNDSYHSDASSVGLSSPSSAAGPNSPGELEDSEVYKHRVVQEIIDTEKSYVEALNVLDVVFVEPLKRDFKMQEFDVFSDIEIIKRINNEFYSEIKTCTTDMELCEVFRKRGSAFKLYSHYINNYEKAQVALTSDELKPFLKDCRDKLKNLGFRQTDISSFLIQPVQRLPRYQLLFQDLLRHTNISHAHEYKILEDTVNTIRSIASYCNVKKTEANKVNKMRELAKELRLKDFFKQGRNLELEGRAKVVKKTRLSEKSIYLFTDILLIVSKSRRLEVQFPFFTDVEGCNVHVTELPDIDGIEVTSTKPAKSVKLVFGDSQKKESWLAEIRKFTH